MSPALPPTRPEVLQEMVRRLAHRKFDWARVGARERIAYLNACLAGVGRVAEEWVEATNAAQRIAPGSPAAGEAWLSGPAVAGRYLRLLAESLVAGAQPRPPRLRRRGDQWIATVAPDGALERLVYRGLEAEEWIAPGQEPTQGRAYRAKEAGDPGAGGVAVVLGAGNVSSIAPRDLAHKLFVEDEVVVLKMHPVNDYLGPLFERAFAPLIDAGYLAIAYGGAEVGATLCHHELVDSIHLTGSHHTHDAIVWGATPQERARRRAAQEPLLHKRVSSELGCVSPVIVVPGRWSDADLRVQATSVAGMITNNASFNCNAAKVLVVHEQWPQREAFLQALRDVLASVPTRHAYYPGAADRHARFRREYPQADLVGGQAPEGHLPWTIIRDVRPEGNAYGLQHEAFCGVVSEVPVAAADPADFLRAAVRTANERIWGSLTCMMIVDPATEAQLGRSLEDAVADLRYGGVAVNAWSGILFLLGRTSWGAFPGNRLDDVGSGIGTSGNSMLFDHPQKSVIRGAYRAWPRPAWFPNHRNVAGVGRALTRFEAAPAWSRLPRLVVAGARG